MLVSVLVSGLGVVQAEEHEELEDGCLECLEEEEIEVLERTVKLHFQVVPAEKDDKGLLIVTTSSVFASSVALAGEDGEVAFGVSGEVEIWDDESIFLCFDAEIVFESEEGRGEFTLMTGVKLAPGKELAVGSVGDKNLVVKADYVDKAGKP